MNSENQWYVYMVRCRDDTLYTGIAKNLEKRIAAHNSDSGGAKYTKPRRPVELVYSEPVPSRSAAAKREYQIKKMPAAEKRAIAGIIRDGKNTT